MEHLPDEYAYCRRCGLNTQELLTATDPCLPPDDVLQLVNRRIGSIVLTNRMELPIFHAIKRMRDIARRHSNPDAA